MPTPESLKAAVQKLQRDRGIRSTLFAFTLTRLIVFAIFVLGMNLKVVEPNRVFGVEAEEVQISLKNSNLLDSLRPLAMRGDGGWFLHIADRGYEHIPFEATLPHNWAFFPLFPLIWRLVASVTGGFLLTGIAVSNVFFFFALLLLYRTAIAFGLDDDSAERAVFYTAAFPTSYFFSLPMSESLFLLLTAGSFLAAKRNRWWVAAILAGLAATTRLSGLVLLPALLALQWEQDHKLRPTRKTLSLLLIPAGVIGYMAYLHSITGNALAFASIEPAWGRRPQFFLFSLFEYLRDPLDLSFKWNFKLLNFSAAILALVCSVILLKRRQWSLGIYLLGAAVLPLSSSTLQSMTRYMMVAFPIFFILGEAGRSVRIDQSIRATFLVLLGIMTTLCVIIVTLALS